MEWKGLVRSAKSILVKKSPQICTLLGIAGFGTTVVMTAKASPKVKSIHMSYEWDRARILDDEPEDEREQMRQTYVQEVKEVSPLVLPVAGVGILSIGCFLAANKIHADRNAALMAAYSLSAETLSRYQGKVIEKLGEEVHADILGESTREMVSDNAPEGLDPEIEVIPMNSVKCYDTVTGRYFYSSKERIMEAESEVNKKLINEVRVPLQEFYYALGMEEHFYLGDVLGWDVSSLYSHDNALNIFFSPMLDDEKNPCLALSYHATIFERSV